MRVLFVLWERGGGRFVGILFIDFSFLRIVFRLGGSVFFLFL